MKKISKKNYIANLVVCFKTMNFLWTNLLELLDEYAPNKNKFLSANHTLYMNKALMKAIMKRSELKSKYF